MSIITFWNYQNVETGKTMSLVATATYMAVEHNVRTLIVSTTNKKDKIKNCFLKEEKRSKINLGIFGPNTKTFDTQTGLKGLEKIVRSGKLEPNAVTNYTKVVFKDRLEVLLGEEEKENETEVEKNELLKTYETYPDIISAANSYYDRVFVDLDYNIPKEIRDRILQKSDIVILSITQGMSGLELLKQNKANDQLLKSPKTLLIIGRYDRYSKYNAINITRFLKEKNTVLTTPYNTLFFEASEEANVADLFLSLKKFNDPNDYNAFFRSEVKRTTENIIYRLQEIQANIY